MKQGEELNNGTVPIGFSVAINASLSMHNPLFSMLMLGVFEELGLSGSAEPGYEVYTLNFERDESLHFINRQDDYLDVITEAGRLTEPYSADMLLSLLELNGYDGMEFPLSVSVERESGTLLVCYMQRLAILDVPTVIRLTGSIRAKAAMVSRTLVEPSVCRPTSDEDRLLLMKA